MLLVRTYVAASAIHGRGLFARHPIAKGEDVWLFLDATSLILSKALAHEMCRPQYLERFGHWCSLTGRVLIHLDDARFINHSWEPNLTSWAPGNSFSIVIRAARDIAAGEELTVDYRIGDAEPFRGFNREEMEHESTGGASVTIGHAGMADHGQFLDGRHHAEPR